MYPTPYNPVSRAFLRRPLIPLLLLLLFGIALGMTWQIQISESRKAHRMMEQSRQINQEVQEGLKNLNGLHQESRDFVQP